MRRVGNHSNIVAFFDVAWLKYDYIACGSFLTMMTGSDYDTQTRLVSNAVKHNLRVEDLMSKPLPTGIFDEEEMKLRFMVIKVSPPFCQRGYLTRRK